MNKEQWVSQALDQYERRLLRYASRILADTDRARDVVQDVFLALCRQEPARIEPHLAAWLYKVCRNRALDVRRKDRPLEPLDTLASEQSIPAGAAMQVERKETMRQIEKVLQSLSENQREVLTLKFDGELSYKEISEVTGLSVTNVGFILHTALKSVRRQLQSTEERTLRRIK